MKINKKYMGGGMTKPKMMYQEGGISDPKMSKGYTRMVADLERFVARNSESLDPSNEDTFDPNLYSQYEEMKRNLQKFAEMEGMTQREAMETRATRASQTGTGFGENEMLLGGSGEMEGDVETKSKGDIFN